MLDPRIRDLATGRNFAAVTTVFPSGRLQTNPMWLHADDEHIYLNTEVARAKARNVERDPRITVMVWDQGNPYRYAEVRGRVVERIGGDRARRDIDDLSQKYFGRPYPEEQIGSERVILVVDPEQQRFNG